MPNLTRMIVIVLLACALLTTGGCKDKGKDGGSNNANKGNWDSMNWDQGKWQ